MNLGCCMQNSQFRRSSTATSKRRRLICVSSPTKANDTALKRQFPSGDVLAAAISGSKGRSSGTSDIAILSVGKPTWPRSGKVQKNCFSLAYFFYKPRENSKTSLVTVVHAVSILNKVLFPITVTVYFKFKSSQMRAHGRCRHGWKSRECCEPAICVVSKRDISLHNIQRNIWKIQDGGC